VIFWYAERESIVVGGTGAMGGRFGKYGDTKRKAKLRYSGLVKKKGVKTKPEQKRLPAKTGCKHRRLKKKQSNNSLSGKAPG
jgi:hypothetical protein